MTCLQFKMGSSEMFKCKQKKKKSHGLKEIYDLYLKHEETGTEKLNDFPKVQ